MANSIHGLKRQYSLEESKVLRLNSEYELISLRIDFCLYKYNTDRRNLYDLLVLYGGLEEFIHGLSFDKKKFLRNDIEIYNAKVKSETFNKTDKRKLMQILFFDSDHVRDICSGVNKEKYFAYVVPDNNEVSFCFSNLVTPISSSKDDRIEIVKEELREIAKELKYNNPQIEYISSSSWMWNLEVFQEFMPKEFIESLHISDGHKIYGFQYWNQFIKSDGGLDKRKIKEFKRTWKFPYSVLSGKCKISEFFEIYLDEP
jgi:hypothetical protein